MPDISTFLVLCDWLEVSPATLFKHSASKQQSNSPSLDYEPATSKVEQLALLVKADSRLSPATANVLSALINAAYAISAENSKQCKI
ncbi:MAG: hypothetical protein AAF329_24250 [Cyanobacteria bacterium P01_A01_bin.17]